jgi:hypothetical protein
LSDWDEAIRPVWMRKRLTRATQPLLTPLIRESGRSSSGPLPLAADDDTSTVAWILPALHVIRPLDPVDKAVTAPVVRLVIWANIRTHRFTLSLRIIFVFPSG